MLFSPATFSTSSSGLCCVSMPDESLQRCLCLPWDLLPARHARTAKHRRGLELKPTGSSNTLYHDTNPPVNLILHFAHFQRRCIHTAAACAKGHHVMRSAEPHHLQRPERQFCGTLPSIHFLSRTGDNGT